MAQADPLRVATYNTELYRDGPGLLLRDILKGDDPQIDAVVTMITKIAPDILVLQGVDYDLQRATLNALAEVLAQSGTDYPYRFALPPNAGHQTLYDLDGDGRLGGPRDAQGYGRFLGQGAMAVLSRFPINDELVQDYSTLLWRDLPNASLPMTDDGPFPSLAAQNARRLSSNGHWVIPVDVPEIGVVTLMTFHATPPVFDGPEDLNGLRNHDEIMFWDHYLGGAFDAPPSRQFVLLGDANLDPETGDGLKIAIQTILDHPKLQETLQGYPTVAWEGLGEMRVDYLLPSTDWRIRDAGVSRNAIASRHGIVWADLER